MDVLRGKGYTANDRFRFLSREAALRREMQETLARCKGKEAGTGNIRGIGAERRAGRVEMPEGILEGKSLTSKCCSCFVVGKWLTQGWCSIPCFGKVPRTDDAAGFCHAAHDAAAGGRETWETPSTEAVCLGIEALRPSRLPAQGWVYTWSI